MRLILFVCLSMVLISCSSTPKNKSTDAAIIDANPGLVLHGNSDSGNAGGLKTVFFQKDSSVLNDSSKSALKNNADFLNNNNNVSVEIEGHCDERGGRQYNLSLGERRAKTTRDYLTALGVAANQMTTISYGNEKPLSEGHQESEWSKNRRANFSVTAK